MYNTVRVAETYGERTNHRRNRRRHSRPSKRDFKNVRNPNEFPDQQDAGADAPTVRNHHTTKQLTMYKSLAPTISFHAKLRRIAMLAPDKISTDDDNLEVTIAYLIAGQKTHSFHTYSERSLPEWSILETAIRDWVTKENCYTMQFSTPIGHTASILNQRNQKFSGESKISHAHALVDAYLAYLEAKLHHSLNKKPILLRLLEGWR